MTDYIFTASDTTDDQDWYKYHWVKALKSTQSQYGLHFSSFFIYKPLFLIEFIIFVLSLIFPPSHQGINPCMLYTFL